ncbi:MAG: hypothetical protein KIT57_03680 [Blastocatellales bacterium]|nr:hypothetical protein [Blastocatellales bacterium]
MQESIAQRLAAAIRERDRLLRRARSLTVRRMPIPDRLRRDLDFAALEIDRLREEARDAQSAA